MLLSSLFSSSSLPRSPSEQIALDDASRLECPSFFPSSLSLSLSFAFLPLPVSAFIYSDGKTRKEGSKTGEKARGGSSGEDEDEEEEGESKTNKRIRGGKIVLKDLKLSLRQYALPAVKTRIGSSFISETRRAAALLSCTKWASAVHYMMNYTSHRLRDVYFARFPDYKEDST